MARILNSHEETLVIEGLADGYGIEDISVTNRLPIASVRALVREFIGNGTISEIYRKEDNLDRIDNAGDVGRWARQALERGEE